MPHYVEKGFDSSVGHTNISDMSQNELNKVISELNFTPSKILGVSQTDTSQMEGGALPSLTSPSILSQAQSLADAVYGTPKSEPNMALASLLYFSKLAEESSKPGATLLGAAGTAFQSPTAYLLQEKEKERKAEQAKASLVAGLVPTIAKATKKTVKDPQPYTLRDDDEELGSANSTVLLTAEAYDLLSPAQKKKLIPFVEDKTSGSANSYTNISDSSVTIGDKTLESGESTLLFSNELEKLSLDDRGKLQKTIEKPKPSLYERLNTNIVTTAELFFNTEDKSQIDNKVINTLFNNIDQISKERFVPIADPNDPDKTVYVLQQGIDVYKNLERTYGKEKVKLLKEFGLNIQTAEPKIGEDETEAPIYDEFNIGGKTFKILSGKGGKLSTTEAQTLSDATSGLKDVQNAINLMFPNGKYNKALVTTMNIAPTWGLGLVDSLGFDGIAGDARTTIQSMQRSIELILRARSGAAVPPAELENYLRLYLPSALDNEIQARNKLDALLRYFEGTIDGLNKGRNIGGINEDTEWAQTKLPTIIDQSLDAETEEQMILGKRIKIIDGKTYIETEKGSNKYELIVN